MIVGTSLRERLRLATADVHERLHRHSGLAAVAAGTITRSDYSKLLGRLWGFHRAFEAVLADPPAGLDFDPSDRARAGTLGADLLALGMNPAAIEALPVCRYLHCPADAAGFMGALYVVEGSTMGGAQLARALAPLFGGDGDSGRRFFMGYGARNGVMWREFLGHLDRFGGDEGLEAAAVRGAVATFGDFERWVDGWKDADLETAGGARRDHRVSAPG